MLLVDAHDALMLDMNQFVDEYIRQTPFIAINSPTMQAENEKGAMLQILNKSIFMITLLSN